MRVLAVLLLATLIPPPPAAIWEWPTTGPHHVLRDFSAPLTPWGSGHRGLDLAATWDKIVAPVAGVITFSGWVVNRGVITITTAEGHRLSLEPVTPLLTSGERVRAGEVIATLEPGHCATLCVHIGLRVGEDYRSPRRELGILQRAVLLPWE
jgi:murein DD-endopeptidase MepM/ murein hydrolase activator NlpD